MEDVCFHIQRGQLSWTPTVLELLAHNFFSPKTWLSQTMNVIHQKMCTKKVLSREEISQGKRPRRVQIYPFDSHDKT